MPGKLTPRSHLRDEVGVLQSVEHGQQRRPDTPKEKQHAGDPPRREEGVALVALVGVRSSIAHRNVLDHAVGGPENADDECCADVGGATTNVIHRTCGSNTLGIGNATVTTSVATQIPMRFANRMNDRQDDLDADPPAQLTLVDLAQQPRAVFGRRGQPPALPGHRLQDPAQPVRNTLVVVHLVSA